jgi:hypothetical protein
MKPTRFVDDDEGGFAAQLLRSGLSDEPIEGAMKRAETALGLGLGAGLAAKVAATAKGVAKAAAVHLGGANAITQVGVASGVKWVGIGLVSSAVLAGSVHYGAVPALRNVVSQHVTTSLSAPAKRHPNAPRIVSRSSAPAAADTTTVVSIAESAPGATVTEPAPSAAVTEATPSAATTPPNPRRDSARAAAPVEVARLASLADELSILARARHALLAKQPGVVLRELDVYAHTPSARVLEAEAEILGIEALVQQGSIREAQARAVRSLGAAPNGPHAARLREIATMPK